MDWAAILGGVVSAGSGGVLGIAGSLVSKYFKGREQRADRTFEEKKWAHEIELHKLQQATRGQESEEELELLRTQGSQQGMLESIRAEAAIGPTSVWVNNFKACWRPLLTLLLWVLAALIFYDIDGPRWQGILEPQDIIALLRYMVYSVFFCASTATTWWFGDRALSPPKLTRA